ncbi:unnamed protein product [Effrenium voratum]|uniref:Protein kinase domain-containing protein n=1 Tax=Effrenium voratum TaxID=2562239 RepID=A0AA36I506_9DINO|nr:unnamed protein product [Effrenium voratum]
MRALLLAAAAYAARIQIEEDSDFKRRRGLDEEGLKMLAAGNTSMLEHPFGRDDTPSLPEEWKVRLDIEAKIGEGGFGQIFRCKVNCAPTTEFVSVKMVKEDEGSKEEEILKAMHGVSEYCISTVGEPGVVKTGEETWIMTPYFNSGDLFDLRRRCKTTEMCAEGENLQWYWPALGYPFSKAFVLALFYQALQGTQALHGKGFMHRDIKPENIMVSCSEGRLRGKCWATLIDLGLAGPKGEQRAVGTPGYLAPELNPCESECGNPSIDVWSLGATLYRLIYSTPPPFKNDKDGSLAKTYNPYDDSNIPRPPHDLDHLIMAMLDPDPSTRVSLSSALAMLKKVIKDTRPSQEIMEMISNSPVERGASNPEPMCLTENVWGDKDIRNAAFDRALCVDKPKQSWQYKCTMCIRHCQLCCRCHVVRHGRTEKNYYRSTTCN